MRLVKAAKASPHAKLYNLSTAYNYYFCAAEQQINNSMARVVYSHYLENN